MGLPLHFDLLFVEMYCYWPGVLIEFRDCSIAGLIIRPGGFLFEIYLSLYIEI